MFSSGKFSLTKEDILELISEEELLSKYFGITKVPCLINSPLRKDSKPSFAFYTKDNITFWYKDFATNDCGDIFKLLSLYWNTSYNNTLKRIYEDLHININKVNSIFRKSYKKSSRITVRSSIKLEVKVREWEEYDIEYWKSYGIDKGWLKLADIYPISHKIVTTNKGTFTFKCDEYAYAFVERKEGIITIKIYQPYNTKGFKWATSTDRSVISLWTKIPKYGDRLVICSSLKDALCFWSNIGIPALSCQGEGYPISDTAINELKRRYKHIYVLYDNDAPGIKDAEVLCEYTGFKNIILPQFEDGKDVSDLYKSVGKDKFKEIINKLIN